MFKSDKNVSESIIINYGGGPIHKNELEYFKGFIGTEYIITEKE